jgi:cytochrome P450
MDQCLILLLLATDENLTWCVSHLFVAGTETTSTTIKWALLLLLHHPHVQDKCFQEIRDVIGTSRTPTMADRPKMTYLEAFIMEVLRFADIAPMSVPHATADDVTLRGYVIPKDAMIIPFLDSVLQDPDVWGDPENFRPERFISPDGKLTKPHEFIPFSTGRQYWKPICQLVCVCVCVCVCARVCVYL